MPASSIVEQTLATPVVQQADAVNCFHCGLPVPVGTRYSVSITGSDRPMCCRGCQAVAEAIVAAGLSDFYRYRSESSRQVEELVPEQLRDWQLYDRPELQSGFVRASDGDIREASLILEGIVCAACVWLSERHVNALPGVREFRVNYSTHRAQLKWDQRETRLSTILAAIAAIGYQAHPFDPDRQETLQRKERAVALRRLAVAGLGSMQVMMLAVAMYAGDYQGMDEGIRDFLRWISLLITLPVIAYAAHPFFSTAWRSLRQRRPGMDVPVSLAIAGALVVSAWYTWQGGGEVYFDSVTMFTFFLLSGRFLEMSARHRAGEISERLVRLLPAAATRLGPDGEEEIVALAALVPGDRVLIRPGATVPADGIVLEGTSSIDESVLTGESLPLPKLAGSALVGGSVNVESPLVMCVQRVGTDTTLSAIVRLLDRAQSEKPEIALLADRVAGWFVTAILLFAAAVAAWWWQQDAGMILRVTLAVLVVSCPCALSLATPTAITVATGSLMRIGLLTTRGHALETLASVSHVVFDKTGTLTQGRLRLAAVKTRPGIEESRCLAIAAALEWGSEHPVGRALRDAAVSSPPAENLRNTPGKGVEGYIDGRRYRLGRPDFVAELDAGVMPSWREDGLAKATMVALGDEQGVLAEFRLVDSLRPEARQMVKDLQALGLKVLLLSGDQSETVSQTARQLGIQEAEGDLLPADKLERLRALQARGAVIAMVGDGINDAPVLAAAQVSVAMGSGAAIAHAAADIILMADGLDKLVPGFQQARRTQRIIRQNLTWAIGYNLIALPLAAVGWIAPWMAALGMSASSLLVVLNALRLKSIRLGSTAARGRGS